MVGVALSVCSNKIYSVQEQENLPTIFTYFTKEPSLPWIPLGKFPTPVHRLKNLEKELELKSLWIKRDDLSGELYGGNKVRTLEFSLADALRENAKVVFTYSALGSNWPLACTVYTRLVGLSTWVFFFPRPLDEVKKQNLDWIYRLACRVMESRSIFTFLWNLYYKKRTTQREKNVYLMPPGGTSPLTTLGHINAILELKEQQSRESFPIPDVIVCPLGSGGTAAGLSIGLQLIGWPTQVLAVRVVDWLVGNFWNLQYLIRKTFKFFEEKSGITFSWEKNVRILHNYCGPGYSHPTELCKKAVAVLKEKENQTMDTTYTGKTFAAIFDLARKGRLKDKHVLFWHTLNSRNLENLKKLV